MTSLSTPVLVTIHGGQGSADHGVRSLTCRAVQGLMTTIMGAALMSLVMLTMDRYLSIHQGMRYTVIMKTTKGWWMVLLTWAFCLCMGSIVFTVTNLIENHECTYVFSIAKVT